MNIDRDINRDLNRGLNHDELRRELRAVEADHQASMAPWREALKRIFAEKGSGIPATAKAELLGVPAPGRRQFFKFGGATIIGAAILAACGDDDDDEADGSGDDNGDGESAATEMDVVLLRTATSLELLAVAAYQTAIDSGVVTTRSIADAAVLFQSHHQEHAEALQGATEANGGTPFTEPNQFVFDNVVTPALPSLTSETAIVGFAATLEDAAAQTYAFAAGALSTPEFRQTIMSIGGVEARHLAILRTSLGDPAVPLAFLPTDGAIPAESFVSAS